MGSNSPAASSSIPTPRTASGGSIGPPDEVLVVGIDDDAAGEFEPTHDLDDWAIEVEEVREIAAV